MAKIRRLSQSTQRAAESLDIFPAERYEVGFLSSDLGKIYQAIPWQEMVEAFGLKEKAVGRKSIFSPQGKLGLMLLKNYVGCSDTRLLEQLNGNLYFQLFCDLVIDPLFPLKHRQLVSRIRGELAHQLSIADAQQVLADYWKPYLDACTNVLIDATCYESEVRYPTDVKLLWESVSWLHDRLRKGFKELRHPIPRTKYAKWALLYQGYRRKRKPRVKDRRRIKGGLLRLLKKLLEVADAAPGGSICLLELKDQPRFNLLKTVYEQQYLLFTTGEKPTGRIVSLAKPYVRPIVRGKENKPVEFGAKVNKIQIDGINFLEHIDFEAFHEGNRLKVSVFTTRKLVGKINLLGADGIYATNQNRTYCRKNHIFTDFKPKGRKGKWEPHNQILRKAITRERASRLEGSFGNEKNYYHLRKIKARTKENEILWIFFGIHVANALTIGRRMAQAQVKQTA